MSDDRGEQRPNEIEVPREGWLERLIGRFGHRPRESMRDDLQEVLSDATEAADLSPRERLMLKNVLGFHRIRVSDVMVPRADIIAVSSDMTLGEVLQIFRTAGHSRLPAYGETLDEPLGMVHIRDFVDHLAKAGVAQPPPETVGPEPPPAELSVDLSVTLASADMLRPVLFVPRSMPAIDLLGRMQVQHTHMALVIDEYGGTDGLVSIEDLVETVVGDIEDEHDEVEHMIVVEEAGTLLADARAGLDEVSEALGGELGVAAEHEGVDTLGGFIVARIGRVPARGELIAGPDGLEFEVLDADPRRLKRVRIHRRSAATEPAATTAGEPGPATRPDNGPAGDRDLRS
ncbi:hemolysin family protein [uncultured Enterovirga sp.]|uniref:hemolysin family protein n=1 Tax=uncultured Enterovirga sp. TaxID=2026352 RepID=UPI0035CA8D26